jgi:hypothetical protein
VTGEDESDAILLADVGGTNVLFAALGRAGPGLKRCPDWRGMPPSE